MWFRGEQVPSGDNRCLAGRGSMYHYFDEGYYQKAFGIVLYAQDFIWVYKAFREFGEGMKIADIPSWYLERSSFIHSYTNVFLNKTPLLSLQGKSKDVLTW